MSGRSPRLPKAIRAGCFPGRAKAKDTRPDSQTTGDLNDATLVSAILSDDRMTQTLAGTTDTPPDNAEVLAWEGGRMPEAALPLAVIGQNILKRMALSRSPAAPMDAGISCDRPDSRDRIYEPTLVFLDQQVLPGANVVGDQLNEGSCASLAVAAAIEHQLARRAGYTASAHFKASVRMLDRMARRHDEWLDDSLDGTSLHAVMEGLYLNGVCGWDKSPYIPRMTEFFLTHDIAKDNPQPNHGQLSAGPPIGQ